MKTLWLVVLLACVGCGDQKSDGTIVDGPPTAPKALGSTEIVTHSWKPEMCAVQQQEASEEFIRYCMKVAPNVNPLCTTEGHDPREAMWAAQAGYAEGKHGAYFEVLDCSWHPGMNPREKKHEAE